MSPSAPRQYDGTRRREGAQRSRAAVLTAGRELLLRDGYRASTLKAIAQRAGVSVELVYKAFGSKPGLLKALYDVTLAGDDEPVPIGGRAEIARVLAESDLPTALRRYAGFVAGLQERLSVLLPVLAEADPDVAQLRAQAEAERLTGVRALLRELADRGRLDPELDLDRTADACWALTSPQLHAQLTAVRGWSRAEYASWIGEMLITNLTKSGTSAGSTAV